jgi:phosphatidylserine/phosphatidylglycerophosphate/cardiolipin synthase-like enzyme
MVVSNISTQGFDLAWTTNIKGSTALRYGNTPAMELGVLAGTADSTWHLVSVTGAYPSELFYAQAISVAGADTAWSGVNAYITKSSSTGVMKAYFNRTVDNSVSSGTDAVHLHLSMDDTLAAYVNRAKYSIDLATYSYNTSGIADITAALNAAHDRGVRVRIVADWHTWEQKRWEILDPDIGIMISPQDDYNASTGIMHNKFLIIDAVSPDPADAYVWTGSGNITEDQLHHHANNVIIIQDQSLATVYQLEFEEMFGSSGSQPDSAASKFGTSKKNNTPHELVIGNIPVECYFSPTDRVNQIISDNINRAAYELYVNTMLITRDFLAEAIVERNDAGVVSQVIINDENDPADNEYVMGILKDLGQNFRQNGEGSILHHKTMIIDQGYPAADPLVLTGSHNWSSSADTRNDENTLIIHDGTLANIYYQEFSERFRNGEIIGNTSVDATGTTGRQELFIYPNPNSGSFILISPFLMEVRADLEIFTSDGRPIWSARTGLVPGENPVILPTKPERGLYILQLRHKGGMERCLFISQ